jgi:hypothetical protein
MLSKISNLRLAIFFPFCMAYACCSAQKQASGRLDYSLPKEAYKSRLKASDPRSWKPVQVRVEVPTSGVSPSDKGGCSKPQLTEMPNYLLHSFSLDHMLEPFRVRAGLPVTPDTLAQVDFWDTKLRGSNGGRFLMGAGNSLRWIHNTKLQDGLNKLIEGIEQCREVDGYILPYKPDSVRSEEPNYARAWLTHGLIDAGISGNQKAYTLLRGHADWFNKWHCYAPETLYWPNNSHSAHASTRTYLSL